MTSIPWFHACTSCKANVHLSDKHPLCVQCLGVQHATEAMDREDFYNLCAAFQPRVPIMGLAHERDRWTALGLSDVVASTESLYTYKWKYFHDLVSDYKS
ncbi:UNVERIFIED_CONTAM: hypothetical protein FKN15_057379 [Acipenser sinensis]